MTELRRRLAASFGALVLGILLTNGVLGQEQDTGKRWLKNEAFGLDEQLFYKVGYKFITAGNASFKVMPKPVMRNGQRCFDIRFEVRSLKSLEWIYRVHNLYRTVVDIDGIFPHEFEQYQREGGYKKDFKARFDQTRHLALANDTTYPIPPFVHDVVSALYYVRTLDMSQMQNGTVIRLSNFYDDSTHNLGVRIHSRETIEVGAGRFKCIKIEPVVLSGGLFKSEGRIFIWVSDDDRKVPVKVSSKIIIGSIDAELTDFKGLRGPITAKVED